VLGSILGEMEDIAKFGGGEMPFDYFGITNTRY
jgi:hypothetical protein